MLIAEAGKISPSHVVDEDQDDVGPVRLQLHAHQHDD